MPYNLEVAQLPWGARCLLCGEPLSDPWRVSYAGLW